MREEYKKDGIQPQANRGGLSIVSVNGLRADRGSLSQKIVQCSTCLHQAEYTSGQEKCGICGAELSSPNDESSYSGYEPNLLTMGHAIYHLKPQGRIVNERRYPRITCRNVKACINTEQVSNVIVDIINISRGGVCFTSVADFYPGTPVSIATHYIEGGQNIYQDGRIIRVQRKASGLFPGEYAIEFLRNTVSRP